MITWLCIPDLHQKIQNYITLYNEGGKRSLVYTKLKYTAVFNSRHDLSLS